MTALDFLVSAKVLNLITEAELLEKKKKKDIFPFTLKVFEDIEASFSPIVVRVSEEKTSLIELAKSDSFGESVIIKGKIPKIIAKDFIDEDITKNNSDYIEELTIHNIKSFIKFICMMKDYRLNNKNKDEETKTNKLIAQAYINIAKELKFDALINTLGFGNLLNLELGDAMSLFLETIIPFTKKDLTVEDVESFLSKLYINIYPSEHTPVRVWKEDLPWPHRVKTFNIYSKQPGFRLEISDKNNDIRVRCDYFDGIFSAEINTSGWDVNFGFTHYIDGIAGSIRVYAEGKSLQIGFPDREILKYIINYVPQKEKGTIASEDMIRSHIESLNNATNDLNRFLYGPKKPTRRLKKK